LERLPVSDPADERRIVAAGAALGCVGVILGAFGAHALKGQVSVEALGWWQTAVQYQMWHALAVVGLGLSRCGRQAFLPAMLFVAGVVIFSGTLYAMALGAPRWLGAITPLGGLLLISGWALLGWRAVQRSS
jgi:uncharacterized membrane protein YgdD (TMEM256/DUF423 family)